MGIILDEFVTSANVMSHNYNPLFKRLTNTDAMYTIPPPYTVCIFVAAYDNMFVNEFS